MTLLASLLISTNATAAQVCLILAALLCLIAGVVAGLANTVWGILLAVALAIAFFGLALAIT